MNWKNRFFNLYINISSGPRFAGLSDYQDYLINSNLDSEQTNY